MFTVRKPSFRSPSSRTEDAIRLQGGPSTTSLVVRRIPRDERTKSAVKKIRNRRALAGLILAACVTLSIAYAGTGGAAPPTSGNTCQLDGKISGRGATFQTRAQVAWAAAFTRDVCGAVADTAAGND